MVWVVLIRSMGTSKQCFVVGESRPSQTGLAGLNGLTGLTGMAT